LEIGGRKGGVHEWLNALEATEHVRNSVIPVIPVRVIKSTEEDQQACPAELMAADQSIRVSMLCSIG